MSHEPSASFCVHGESCHCFSRRSPDSRLEVAVSLGVCGDGRSLDDRKIGCGEPYLAEEQKFRCADCSVSFCKFCLRKHFDYSRSPALDKVAEAREKVIEASRNLRSVQADNNDRLANGEGRDAALAEDDALQDIDNALAAYDAALEASKEKP